MSEGDGRELHVTKVTSDVGHFRTYTFTVSDHPTMGPQFPVDVPDDVAETLTTWLDKEPPG